MVSKITLQRDARKLFKLSLGADGRLDPARVTDVLGALERHPPAGYLALLRAYRRLVAAEVYRGQARLEHAGALAPADAAAVTTGFARRYGRPLEAVVSPQPGLIAGLSVRVGDDVHELSVAGTLAGLRTDA